MTVHSILEADGSAPGGLTVTITTALQTASHRAGMDGPLRAGLASYRTCSTHRRGVQERYWHGSQGDASKLRSGLKSSSKWRKRMGINNIFSVRSSPCLLPSRVAPASPTRRYYAAVFHCNRGNERDQ